MNDIEELLESTKSIVQKIAHKIINYSESDDLKAYHFDHNIDKEIKALADSVIEENLLSELKPLGIPILSEESGLIKSSESEYLFVVDPLDGTFNYVRNFGSSAISVALFKQDKPLFGVIYDIEKQLLYWGGSIYGAYCGETKINVSNSTILRQSLVCSGFPVRYNLDKITEDNLLNILTSFAKVRMIGSAAISIANVAQGTSDAYFEKNIMLWDIAAGLAIVEGAGGSYFLIPTSEEYSFDVGVSNNELLKKIKAII